MRILVLGAGAVGGYFGGRLAQKGTDVSFLVRPKRAEALARDGLRIASRFGDSRQQVACVTQDQLQPHYDVIVLTAKAYDLSGAIDAIAPAMGGKDDARGVVLPLLNGIAHMELLDRRFGRKRVLGGVAYIAATLAPDGEILVIIQCEETRAIDNLPRMLKEVPGIGVVLIGEGDLSQELGYPRDYDHPAVAEAINNILRICKEHNVPCGHPHPDAKNIERLVASGFRFLMPSSPRTFGVLDQGRKLSGRN